MRVFVDTDVLFDVFAQRQPFFEASQKLLIMQACGDAELWAAPQSYLDIFYILKKARPADEVQQALAHSLDRINLGTTGHEDVMAACTAGWDDAEDALIGASCRKANADYLVTRDDKQRKFKTLGIPAFTPEELFALIEREHGIIYGPIDI
jgi:predicted nucleic acid-binding protein